MPDLVGLPLHEDAHGLPVAALVEQAQLHPFCVFGKQREIYNFTIPAGPERIGLHGPDSS
jgi:hypothetical protein